MKILILCNKSPYPAHEGGPMAMNSIVQGLINSGQQVKIMAVNSKKYHVTDDDIPEDYRKKTGIELINVDLRFKPLRISLRTSRITWSVSSPRNSPAA